MGTLCAVVAAAALSAGAQEQAARALIQQARLVHPVPGSAVATLSSWQWLADADLEGGEHHLRHAELFSKYAVGYNAKILQAVDLVQGSVKGGGGYFRGVHAEPAESPIGYALSLFGAALLKPPRVTSFCTGASYSAFIEALNLIFPKPGLPLSPERLEALRMQEPDGGRREDLVKFWGNWNADDLGNEYALVQYSRMGDVMAPEQARAGDFINVHWTSGGSHSGIFLGWRRAGKGHQLLLWSSQESTDGLGDYLIPISRVAGVKVVRLTRPEALGTFAVDAPVDVRKDWDRLPWDETPRRRRVAKSRSRRR